MAGCDFWDADIGKDGTRVPVEAAEGNEVKVDETNVRYPAGKGGGE